MPKISRLGGVEVVKTTPQERSSERVIEQSESPDQLWQRMLEQYINLDALRGFVNGVLFQLCAMIFSSHRRTGTSEVSCVTELRACVSKHCRNKKVAVKLSSPKVLMNALASWERAGLG